MMRTVFFASFFIVVLTGLSQESEPIFVVLKSDVIFFKNREFYIDSIVDARAVKSGIGTAELNKVKREMRLSAPFIHTLKTYFEALTPARTGMKPIVLIVDELNVTEKVRGQAEWGSAEVAFTFCRIHAGRLMTIGKFNDREASTTLESDTAPAIRLGIAVKKCLLDFNSSRWQTAEPEDLLRYPEFVRTDHAHDILFAVKRERGTYVNYPQMRSNRPEAKVVGLVQKENIYVAVDSTVEKQVLDVFGVCDGVDIFINTRFYNLYATRPFFAKVIVEGRYMIWKDDSISGTSRPVQNLVALDLRTGIITPLTTENRVEALFADDRLFLENFRRVPNNRLPSVILSYIISYNKAHPLL